MHIPDSMLQGSVCSVTTVVSVVGIIVACYYGIKAQKRPTAAGFGAITALIFAGQMMNFTIMSGTSGHLLGGILAASLLGTPFGVLAIGLVVTIQSLVFSDGGLTVLGANILNMAIIGAGMGGILRSKLLTHWDSQQGKYAATAIAAWLSVIAAAFFVSVELAVAGQIGFFEILPAMAGTHALIGIGEAIITVLVCLLLLPLYNTTTGTKGEVVAPLIPAGVVVSLSGPFASGSPDGLEWVAEKHHFMHQSAPTFVGPLSDYALPWISHEMLSTGIAGLLGVSVSFSIAWLLFRTINLSISTQKSV